MHVPDGFLDAPTSIATGVVAAAAVGVALRGARRELDERTAPLAGLAAAFVFAAQMFNFPVGAGTSGHLLGGALAAVLVGPFTAVLCLSVVLLVQSLMFADGGSPRSAPTSCCSASWACVAAWLVFRGLQSVLPAAGRTRGAAGRGRRLRRRCRSPRSPSSACTPSAAPRPSRWTPWPPRCSAGTPLIGLGEALITGLVVGSVVAARPDLVHGARRVLARRELEIRTRLRRHDGVGRERREGPAHPAGAGRPAGRHPAAGRRRQLLRLLRPRRARTGSREDEGFAVDRVRARVGRRPAVGLRGRPGSTTSGSPAVWPAWPASWWSCC